jgi:hypothetical protein
MTEFRIQDSESATRVVDLSLGNVALLQTQFIRVYSKEDNSRDYPKDGIIAIK